MLLTLIIIGVIVGVSGDDNRDIIFTEEFTETVLVENGEALTKQTEKVFVLKMFGTHQFLFRENAVFNICSDFYLKLCSNRLNLCVFHA